MRTVTGIYVQGYRLPFKKMNRILSDFVSVQEYWKLKNDSLRKFSLTL